MLAARARAYFQPDVDGALWGQDALMALGAAAVLGFVKGGTVMRSAAHRARTRIIRRGRTAPPWTVFEPAVLILIVGMMGLGFAIRLAPYPEVYRPWVVGVVYPAVALALIIGSRPLLDPPPPPIGRYGRVGSY